MDSMICNLASILLGLAAWTLPLVYLATGKRRGLCCGSSFALCALSLYLQLREVMHRAGIGDFAAIDDTIRAVVFAANVLLITTAVLNALALLRKER